MDIICSSFISLYCDRARGGGGFKPFELKYPQILLLPLMPQSAKGKKVVGRLLKLKLGLLLKNGQSRPLFVYFQTINRLKTVDFSGIRTRIVRVEGGHADHDPQSLSNTSERNQELSAVHIRSITIAAIQIANKPLKLVAEMRIS